MKRCINWFTQWVKKMRHEEKIGFALGAIISVVVGVIWFVSIDKVPATANDYKTLENQMAAIQQNPDLLFKTNCNIYINDNVITVNFMNDECSMTVQYDQNFEVLSTSKADNYTFWLYALGEAVFIGFIVYCIGSFLLIVAVYLFEILWEFILSKFKAIKSKYV